MGAPELAQLELLAQIDELTARLTQWAEQESPWEPLRRARALVRRLMRRVETLRIRLESPLVVATFGGTGTGKSSLVNALVGQECTTSGRQRPTTRRPVLIVHPKTETETLGIPLEEVELVQVDSPVLRDIVILDCPDPDTSETDSPGTNLERLHRLLPHCDVLIYTSTQQKYRSARVLDELGQAATGCRLLFVQTHADVDSDIRDDWRGHLSDRYEVPDMFFVDSVRALQEQREGRRPSGEFARLQDVLTTELAASQRVQVRRANLIDLIHAALEHCRRQVTDQWPQIEQLKGALEEQRRKLTERMTDQLQGELLVSRHLWERRLLGSVAEYWGFSPFSSVLRFYNGLGSFIASTSLFRARTSAQMALIGAVHGARVLRSRQEEQQTEQRLERLGTFGIDDDLLRESQFVASGYVVTAKLDPVLVNQASLDALRNEAARVEGQFLGDAGRKINEVIDDLALRNSGLFTRVRYEILFLAYLAFVLFLVGRNFFYEFFWLRQRGVLFGTEFYVPAAVFFFLWTGLLVMLFTRRLRRGLERRVNELARSLAQSRLANGLFPGLEQTCRDLELQRARLAALADTTAELRSQIARSSELGAPLVPLGEPVVTTARA